MSYTPTKWANGKAPAINADNLNKIENELVKLDDSVSKLEKVVEKSDITTTTSTTMSNSHDGRLKVDEIGGGESEQETTTGANLIDISYTVTGYKLPIPLEAGVYTLSFKTTGQTGGFRLSNSTDTSSNSAVMTGGKDASGYVVLSLTTSFVSNFINISSDGTISEVMLNEGTEALPYEPYTGGSPSPSPSYPQEVKKTVVSEIRTHGKNFAKLTENQGWKHTENGIKNSGSISGKVLTTINLKAGKTYTISMSVLSAPTTSTTLQCLVDGVDYHACSFSGFDSYELNKVYSKTYTAENDCVMSYKMWGNANSDIFEFTFQIEEGTVATPYEPYQESSITLSQPIELYGIGDLQDVIEDGKVKRRFGVFKLPATFSVNNQGLYYIMPSLPALFNVSVSDVLFAPMYMCTNFAPNYEATFGANDDNKLQLYVRKSDNVQRIFIKASGFATVNAFNEYLSNNDVYLYYPLSKETTEDLPLADQIALNSLETYDGITYLEFDAEVQPTFKGEYGTSKVGGYTLEGMLAGRNGELYGQSYSERLSALEASVVNNI